MSRNIYMHFCVLKYYWSTVNVQGVRSRRNVLKYISKEDEKYCSIVERVNYRSLTGQGLGLHVHVHLGSVILLCWNIHNTIGCYKNCIARDSAECNVSYQVWRMLRSRGLDGLCRCCYSFAYALPGDRGEPCIFMVNQESVNHSLLDKLYMSWDVSGCLCQCPDLSFLETSKMKAMISSCLKSSNMTLIKATFGKLSELSRVNQLELIARMKLQDA